MRSNIFVICTVFIFIFCFEYFYLTHFNFHKWWKPELYDDKPFYTAVSHLHKRYIDHGDYLARQRRIVIAGLCRDVADVIVKNIKISQHIGEAFKDYRIVLFENDSKDDTRLLIKEMVQENGRIILLDCENEECRLHYPEMYELGPFGKRRYRKMAALRNIYLDYIIRYFADFDYMMIMDFDMLGSTNINGILDSIGREIDTEWDAISNMGFMNVPGFIGLLCMPYDALALVFYDEDLVYRTSGTRGKLVKKFISQLSHNMTNDDLIRVRSSFHGMILYKISSILDCKYDAVYGCEHIAFNAPLKNVFINSTWTSYFGIQGPRDWKQLLFGV